MERLSSTSRCCGNCHTLLSMGQYKTCSRCSVYVYCNKECQANHWKKLHKNACKKLVPQPKTGFDFNNFPKYKSISPAITEDLDELYDYILLRPYRKANSEELDYSFEDFLETTQ
eukprot:Awhi_evm1s14976